MKYFSITFSTITVLAARGIVNKVAGKASLQKIWGFGEHG